MDCATLLIGVYLIVDTWLQRDGARRIRPAGGAPPRFSDAEMLTLLLVHQLAFADWHERRWLRWLHRPGYHAWLRRVGVTTAIRRSVAQRSCRGPAAAGRSAARSRL